MSKPFICIVRQHAVEPPESFIRMHIENLPARVRTLAGVTPGMLVKNSPELLPMTWPLRLIRGLERAVSLKTMDEQIFAAVAKHLNKMSVQLVLAEYGHTGVGIYRACQLADIPLIVHFHGHDAYRDSVLERYGAEYCAMFEYAAKVVAVSRHMINQLESLGAPRKKIMLLPYGVDTSVFGGSTPETCQPVFLFVGRFVEKKAPHLTLQAFQMAWRQEPSIKLVMVGDGPLLPVCRQMARSMGIAKAVEFRGGLSHREVAVLMREARGLVQHSIKAGDGDSEGTPVAVLEAGASGLPVVATRHAGIVDAVEENVTGLLVEEGDIIGMAAGMVLLARQAERAAEMGQKARVHIQKHFEANRQIALLWQTMIEEIERFRRTPE